MNVCCRLSCNEDLINSRDTPRAKKYRGRAMPRLPSRPRLRHAILYLMIHIISYKQYEYTLLIVQLCSLVDFSGFNERAASAFPTLSAAPPRLVLCFHNAVRAFLTIVCRYCILAADSGRRLRDKGVPQPR